MKEKKTLIKSNEERYKDKERKNDENE